MIERHDQFRLSFTYGAWIDNFETGEALTDPKALARLDGVIENTVGPEGLAAYVLPGDLPGGIGLRRAVPRLRFDDEEERLLFEIALETDRQPTEVDIEQLAAFCHRQIEGAWGGNYEFVLPAGFDEHMPHFDSRPLEDIPSQGNDALDAVLREHAGWDFGSLSAMSDDELKALRARLEPLVSFSSDKRARDLQFAVEAQVQRRAVGRSEIPKVDLDNLDALDDLPDDVF